MYNHTNVNHKSIIGHNQRFRCKTIFLEIWIFQEIWKNNCDCDFIVWQSFYRI